MEVVISDQIAQFGTLVREWRARRGLSQLDLALQADVSARHLSFLETGRSHPSREMVLRLAIALDLPLRERNELLLGAGFAPRYSQRAMDDVALEQAHAALEFILRMHEPYPAFVLDREWNIVLANRPQRRLQEELLGPASHRQPANVLDWMFEPGPVRDSIDNWSEVARVVLMRLKRQLARVSADDPLQARSKRILAGSSAADLNSLEPNADPAPVLVPMHTRLGPRRLSWFTTLAVFGATGDVTLDELVIESLFPADEATRATVEKLLT